MKRQKGFTLVELLVVMAVIGLLVAVLLPTLGKARKHAQLILCMSQLRQNGVALLAYQGSNKEYFPLFGGVPYYDIYGRTCSTSASQAQGWTRFVFNPTFINNWTTPPSAGFFPEYLNAKTGTGEYKSRKLLNCPLVDFTQYPPFWPEYAANPAYYNIDLASYGIVGYNYYPGRQLAGSGGGNFNTIRRRNDPKELLVTDQLQQQANYTNLSGGTGYTNAVPWFNPHENRSCTLTREGDAFQLIASGVVERFRFVDAVAVDPTCYSIPYANAVQVGPGWSLTDGPYWISAN